MTRGRPRARGSSRRASVVRRPDRREGSRAGRPLLGAGGVPAAAEDRVQRRGARGMGIVYSARARRGRHDLLLLQARGRGRVAEDGQAARGDAGGAAAGGDAAGRHAGRAGGLQLPRRLAGRSTSPRRASTGSSRIPTTRWTGCSRRTTRRTARADGRRFSARSARWRWARRHTSGPSSTKSCWTNPGEVARVVRRRPLLGVHASGAARARRRRHPIRRGDVKPVHEDITVAAGGKNIWLVGGGELVGSSPMPSLWTNFSSTSRR